MKNGIGKLAAIVLEIMIAFAITAPPANTQSGDAYDMVLKGGYVMDPANGRNSVMDVAVLGGKIARVDRDIPAVGAKRTVNVSGFYVTPGLIDIHVHVFFTFKSPSAVSLAPDTISFPSGVTTVVDAGTVGSESFPAFKKDVIETSKTRVLAFLNIAAPGMTNAEQDPLQFKVPLAVATAKQSPEYIVGFKSAHYWTSANYDSIHTPWASVDSVVAAGRGAGLPVMIDFYPRAAQGGYPERSYRELILEKLRPGDIHTHEYAKHIPVLTAAGAVDSTIFKARSRGVILDVGHGAGSFVFSNAKPAIAQGYTPSSISTDLHESSLKGSAQSMTNVMSKLLCLGMPLEEVIRCSTVNPAREINRRELGNLSPGAPADIAVLCLLNGSFTYTDTDGKVMYGDRKIACEMTMLGGEVVYDPNGRSRNGSSVHEERGPELFSVAQNTPNPFNTSTVIHFNLSRAGHTTVEIVNAAGQKVDTVANGFMYAGEHSVIWNAKDFSAGEYFFTVRFGKFSRSVKMILLK
jgi:dihydroorotase